MINALRLLFAHGSLTRQAKPRKTARLVSTSSLIALLRLGVVFGITAQGALAQQSSKRWRVWTSVKGAQLKAALERVENDTVFLQDTKGKRHVFPKSALLPKDQGLIDKWAKSRHDHTLKLALASAGKPKAPEKRPLRLCKIAIDISYNCYKNTFKESEEETHQAVQRIITELNRIWIPEAGIQYKVGHLEIRTNKSKDPYQATRQSGTLYGIGRTENAKHNCDVTFILCQGTDFGGGLGGGRCVWINWTTDMWDVMHHEFSHAFGTGHGHGWPLERGTMNLKAQGSRYPRERNHTLNYVELGIIWDNTKKLPTLDAPYDPLPPFAHFDELHFGKSKRKKSRLDSNDASIQLILDPLANDHDINGDEIRLSKVDPTSSRNAKITKLKDNRLFYDLNSSFAQYVDYDFLHYTIVDKGGLESRGCIALFFDKSKKLLSNGDFSNGKSGWKFKQANIVDNGEAVTSIKIDKRALLQPGGKIHQEIELDSYLSKNYVLEATIYCGPEKNEKGTVVRPSENPKLIVELFNDDRKITHQVEEKDTTLKLPFQLEKQYQESFELSFKNAGVVPVRVGHILIRPVR